MRSARLVPLVKAATGSYSTSVRVQVQSPNGSLVRLANLEDCASGAGHKRMLFEFFGSFHPSLGQMLFAIVASSRARGIQDVGMSGSLEAACEVTRCAVGLDGVEDMRERFQTDALRGA
jgi:hypothetical protein